MSTAQTVRRALYVLAIALVLTAAVIFLLRFLDDQEAQDAPDAAVPTQDLSGFSTVDIVETITAQASRNLGRQVTVTCPPRIELVRDFELTCQMTEAEGENVGAALPDVIVTITDPSASQGARYTWRTTG
ncbi:hypothetical protein HMPREF0063_11168 [Aeromicrobium marinum DSM 15272]|uniref:DUF4333 domain-containing protein n=1 Tax=Aeromicrobium marinum DSM 15272 TaxID=585531 RepID=E2SAW0_9ACTN|nr:hypothetical protein [Aeromicrobium marinum]EFQ83506.1 hypothetical protein HMPREF0063_11168 [Aeromicrobium marinum DSM 15272]